MSSRRTRSLGDASILLSPRDIVNDNIDNTDDNDEYYINGAGGGGGGGGGGNSSSSSSVKSSIRSKNKKSGTTSAAAGRDIHIGRSSIGMRSSSRSLSPPRSASSHHKKRISPTKWMKKFKPSTLSSSSSSSPYNGHGGNYTNTNTNTNTNANAHINKENSHCHESSSSGVNSNNSFSSNWSLKRTLTFPERKNKWNHNNNNSRGMQMQVQEARSNASSTASNNNSRIHIIPSESDDETSVHRHKHNEGNDSHNINRNNDDDGNNDDGDGDDDDDDNDDCSLSACTQSSIEHDLESTRLTAIVWKRKSGLSGLLKSGYVKANERANTFGMKSVSNLQKLMKVNSHSHSHSHSPPSAAPAGAAATMPNVLGQAGGATSTGSGPPSSIKIWERRRIVLEGGILMYYHEDADVGINADENENDDKKSGLSSFATPAMSATTPLMKNRSIAIAKNLKNKLIEFSHSTFPQMNSSHQTQTTENDPYRMTSHSAINTPRGVIDLVETRATASATHFGPYSYAPTPYSLTITVKSEARWVLCFASSKELLSWLGALTDISLKKSIESYQLDYGRLFHPDNDIGSVHKRTILEESDRPNHNEYNESAHSEINDTNHSENDVPLDHDTALDQGLQSSMNSQRRSILSSPKAQRGANTITYQDSFSTLAIINGILLAYSHTIKDTYTTEIFLTLQTIMNGVAWCFFYFNYNKKRATFLDSHTYDACASENNVNYSNEPSSANVIQSSMKSPAQKLSLRARSFSTDYEIRGQPSFVEITKDKVFKNSNNDPAYKPVVGETTVQLKDLAESMNMKDTRDVGWYAASPSIIQLRGAGYLIDKKKVPSPDSLYELTHVDSFDSDMQMLDVGTRFKLPEVKFDSPEGNWRAPNLLVISFALPTTPPKLGKASDNKGYIVVGYYRMREETRKVLQIISNSELSADEERNKLKEIFPDPRDRQRINGVKLWEKWCHCAPTDQEMQKRLKFIPRGENLKEIGVPSWICKYNGKPMLIKRPGVTNFVYSHQDESMMEIDINLHPLPFMFRQAMTYLKEHYFSRMLMTFGFVIEGREDEELPEVLLGDPLQLPYVNTDNVVKSGDVFSRPSI